MPEKKKTASSKTLPFRRRPITFRRVACAAAGVTRGRRGRSLLHPPCTQSHEQARRCPRRTDPRHGAQGRVHALVARPRLSACAEAVKAFVRAGGNDVAASAF